MCYVPLGGLPVVMTGWLSHFVIKNIGDETLQNYCGQTIVNASVLTLASRLITNFIALDYFVFN